MTSPWTGYRRHVFVCTTGSTCPGEGSEEVCKVLRQEIVERGLKGQIRINKSGCLDQCGNGPVIVTYPDGIWYAHVKPEDCREIVESHLIKGQPVERLLYNGCGKLTVKEKPPADSR